MVGMVVPAFVDHERSSGDIGKRLETRCQYRGRGVAILVDITRRQIAKVPVSPRRSVLPCLFRIIVAARPAGRDRLALFLGRFAATIFVNMEAVKPWRHTL